MDTAPFLSGHVAVDVVDKAVADINVAECFVRVLGEDVDAEEVALIVVASVGVGDFEAVDFPVFRIAQTESGGVFPLGVDFWFSAEAVGFQNNGRRFGSAAAGSEHAGEGFSFFKYDMVAGLEGVVRVPVELFLGTDPVFAGRGVQ